MSSEFLVKELLPGLVRFTIPFPMDAKRHVHSYLLFGGSEALLIDAAWDVPLAREALDAALASVGLEVGALRTVLITHMHPDHTGLAAQLQRGGARIGYHPAEQAFLRAHFRRLDESRQQTHLWERLNGRTGASLPWHHDSNSVRASFLEIPETDLPLEGGETVEVGDFRLRPIWTPGHTLGHLCYWEETRQLLFTGDHVLPTISPHVGLYVHSMSDPLLNYIDSLKLLKAYRPDLTIPAHGEPWTDLHGRLDELIEHHHEREQEMYEIVTDEPLTGWEVASRVHWTRRKVMLDQISPWNHRLALAETLAHLELLRAKERLGKEFVGGRILYRRAAPR